MHKIEKPSLLHELLPTNAQTSENIYNVFDHDAFPLPDSDSYTDSISDSYEIGFNDNVQNCFHWT